MFGGHQCTPASQHMQACELLEGQSGAPGPLLQNPTPGLKAHMRPKCASPSPAPIAACQQPIKPWPFPSLTQITLETRHVDNPCDGYY